MRVDLNTKEENFSNVTSRSNYDNIANATGVVLSGGKPEWRCCACFGKAVGSAEIPRENMLQQFYG